MDIDKSGLIGYTLFGIAAFGHFGHNKEIDPIFYYLYIFSYILLIIEKFKIKSLSSNKYSYGHILLLVLYLLNWFWCPFLEENKILLFSLIIMHLFMTIKHSQYEKYAHIIAIFIYGYIGITLFRNTNKKDIDNFKIIGCGILIIYYLQHIFEKEKIHKKIN